jgi:hypothetical protein
MQLKPSITLVAQQLFTSSVNAGDSMKIMRQSLAANMSSPA